MHTQGRLLQAGHARKQSFPNSSIILTKSTPQQACLWMPQVQPLVHLDGFARAQVERSSRAPQL